LEPVLGASGTARAAIAEEFGDVLDPERLMDLRMAVSMLVTNSIHSKDGEVIKIRVWQDAEQIRGQVSDGGRGAPTLLGRIEAHRRAGSSVLDAVTRDWGTEGATAWFVL
jgi:two-component sensor histidine kinase